MAKTAPPTLAELQDLLQRAILSGDDSILDLIPGNSRTSRDVLFGVYRHAYAGRLIGIVKNEHPNLAAYLGDDVFDAVVTGYVAAHPSHTPNARWVSMALPEYLARAPETRGHAGIVELARLERALNDAFDALDSKVLDLAALTAIPPERWEDLTFVAHASARRLDFATNAFAIWGALSREETPPDMRPLDPTEPLLVWRRETTSTVRVMNREEAMLWDEAMQGVPFGALCEMAATYDDPDNAALRVAGYLQGWIQGGALMSAALKPKASAARRLAKA
jgi:Putative DNA-binding domain